MAMDKAAEPDNAPLRKEGKAVRRIPDQTVTVTLWLSGMSDLIYLQTGTIVDYRVPGVSKVTEYRKKGPPPTYPIQDHLYGRGYADMGHDVKLVADILEWCHDLIVLRDSGRSSTRTPRSRAFARASLSVSRDNDHLRQGPYVATPTDRFLVVRRPTPRLGCGR
jgi:hypothetical protein